MAAKPRVGDVGTSFIVTIVDQDAAVVNISTATVKEIRFLSSEGLATDKIASFVTDGSDGKIKHVTVAGDMNVAGVWRLRGYVVMPTGEWRSSVGCFEVVADL